MTFGISIWRIVWQHSIREDRFFVVNSMTIKWCFGLKNKAQIMKKVEKRGRETRLWSFIVKSREKKREKRTLNQRKREKGERTPWKTIFKI